MDEVRREVEAMLAGLDDNLAATMIEFCYKTTKHIEVHRAKKLRLWKEFYEPPPMNNPADRRSAEYKQMIDDKYYQLNKKLPALEKLRTLELERQIALEELNFQVLMAEECEKREDSEKAKETQGTGEGPEDEISEK
ncbi:c9f04205-868d-4d9c-a624-595e8cfdbcc5 [Sclerotinia trifoliorum]|uniref:C9f04205-868d-4d9c-a624-595e8cfdbcc5 n=1 Tax=Sclerotinia trifoliorum TaxID=28548 RepID=A0A8H2W0K2_9HELO|nr:c9f04205-868d-4d9c-a624-595e8cfdbcc5 [Sclerotinia trifoliorum]